LKGLGGWSLFTLLMAVVFHAAFVWYTPRLATSLIVRTIYDRIPEWKINQLGYGPLRYAGNDPVVRDNPDTVTSFAVYDVSEQPLRIRCVVPETDNYWSLSLFAWNTDTIYVVNDRTAPAKVFDITVVNGDNVYQSLADETTVISPSDRGVLLVRMVVTNRDDQQEIERLSEVQRQMYIEPVDGVLY
jgi:uncharacterized membrane protein